MRILHFNSLLHGGGTDDQCVKLVQGLRQMGQDVWIVGPGGRRMSQTIRDLALPFHPVEREGPFKLRLIGETVRLIRQRQIQVVHSHHGRDIWPTILAARLSGRRPKVVLTRHMAKSPSSWASRRFMLGQCDLLIAVSEFVARVLREGVLEPDSPEPERRSRLPIRGDPAKIKVVYGGIDTGRFRPGDASTLRSRWGLEPGHYAFAVVGCYDRPRGKGQREFLQAAARVQERVPRARFLIVGRGNLRETLETDIRQLGLGGKAWLTPYCDDMPAAMNAIDCLVHPQVGTEAFGLVVCEAHACGKPVVASALDGLPEAFAVGGHGQLLPPESVEALAQALAHWAGVPPLAAEEREVLHARVHARFASARLAADVARLYRDLVPGG